MAVRVIFAAILVAMIGIAVAEDGAAAATTKMKVGVLDLVQYDKASEIASQVQYDLIALLNETGLYQCFDQTAIEKTLTDLGDKMPRRCRDPRCVLDIGKSAGMDRMLYGSIEWGKKRCGVQLTLIDVVSRQTVEKVNLQGSAGVAPGEVMKAAVARLHGHDTPAYDSLDGYYGPEVHHEREWLVSSAACLGIGLLYGAINYGVEQDISGTVLHAEYPDDERLSGISTTGVPLFARPAALANAYVAVSDDAYGVLYNPAGMAWISGPEAVLAYQYRFGLNNIAASYVNKATRELGFGQAIVYRSDRDQLMTEMYFVSALAYKFNRMPSPLRPVSLGASVKVLGNRVKSTSDISSGGNSLGLGLDLGLIWEISDVIRYGLLFRDVPVVNYWKNVRTETRYFEPQPATLIMGGTFQAGYSTFLVAEGQIPLYDDQPWKMSGAIEQEFFRIFVLRCGLQREIMAYYAAPWRITGGFGLKVNTDQLAGNYLVLDGSYEYNTLQVFNVINVSLRFGF